MSTPGKKDGQYWDAPGCVDPSPIGPVLALSATRRDGGGQRIPFNGYFFKPLERQAAAAPGGSMDYRVNGHLIKGWAVIAYPAEYGQTGIVSFLVGHAGAAWQKDLSDDTTRKVEAMNAFDPADRRTAVRQWAWGP